MEQADTAGGWRAAGCDVTAVPRQIEQSRHQPGFPGLAEDARMFAKKLARLAEGDEFKTERVAPAAFPASTRCPKMRSIGFDEKHVETQR